MSKPKILIQFDTDGHACAFDGVVAVDSGIDQLFQYGNITLDDVQRLVYGAIFTRGVEDLHQTAIFVGGSDVAKGEAIVEKINNVFFGPMRVSVMMDSNGCNTTAAAAVLAASRHIELNGATATILAGTGPVGVRAARLLAGAGATVRIGSRSQQRASEAAATINERLQSDAVTGVETSSSDQTTAALDGCNILIAAGAAGIQLVDSSCWNGSESLKVAVDLNAVPPLGIESVDVMDQAVDHSGTICYGAVGVGGTKMKIHKAGIASLFKSNDKVLDAEEVFKIGLDQQ